jgi:hypothetical protein
MCRFAFWLALVACAASPVASEAGLTITLGAGPSNSSDLDVITWDFGSNTLGTSGFEGGDTVWVATDSTIIFTGTVGSYEVGVTITNNFPGSPVDAFINEMVFSVRNLGSTNPLSLGIAIDDFTLPGADGSQMSLSNNIAASDFSVGAAQFTSYVTDKFGAEVATPTDFLTNSLDADMTFATFIRGLTFDMRNSLIVSLPENGRMSVTATTIASLPEATSLIAWTSVLCLSGLVHIVRRRRMRWANLD